MVMNRQVSIVVTSLVRNYLDRQVCVHCARARIEKHRLYIFLRLSFLIAAGLFLGIKL